MPNASFALTSMGLSPDFIRVWISLGHAFVSIAIAKQVKDFSSGMNLFCFDFWNLMYDGRQFTSAFLRSKFLILSRVVFCTVEPDVLQICHSSKERFSTTCSCMIRLEKIWVHVSVFVRVHRRLRTHFYHVEWSNVDNKVPPRTKITNVDLILILYPITSCRSYLSIQSLFTKHFAYILLPQPHQCGHNYDNP